MSVDSRKVLLWNLIWPHWGSATKCSESYRAVLPDLSVESVCCTRHPDYRAGYQVFSISDAQRDNP